MSTTPTENKSLSDQAQMALAWNKKGLKLRKTGKLAESIDCYDKAIELDPRNPQAWSNKARALDEQNNLKDALICYKKALEINPNSSSTWNNQGFAYRKLQKYARAIECYDAAIKLAPTYAKAWYNKGYSLDKQGKFEEALECFSKATQFNPANEKYVTSRNSVLQSMKEQGNSPPSRKENPLSNSMSQLDVHFAPRKEGGMTHSSSIGNFMDIEGLDSGESDESYSTCGLRNSISMDTVVDKVELSQILDEDSLRKVDLISSGEHNNKPRPQRDTDDDERDLNDINGGSSSNFNGGFIPSKEDDPTISALEHFHYKVSRLDNIDDADEFLYQIDSLANIIKARKAFLERDKSSHRQEMCSVCMDRPREMVCIPCGHLCLCESCSNQLVQHKCPICNRPFKQIYKVFK